MSLGWFLAGMVLLCLVVLGATLMFLMPEQFIDDNKDRIMLYAAVMTAFSTFILAAAVVFTGVSVTKAMKTPDEDRSEREFNSD